MVPESAVTFASFEAGMRVVVIGASGGIGGALTEALAKSPRAESVIACSRHGAVLDHSKIEAATLDLEDEASIAAVAEHAGRNGQTLDLVIIASGILHDGADLGPEKTWRHLDAEALQRIYRINTIGPALIGKHFLPLLAKNRKSLFAALSARVGSISDNQLGGWHAYRASKAALNMILKNFAIELGRRNSDAICIGLHPGTTDTELSKPFQGQVPKGKLFTSSYAAARLLSVIDGATSEDSGHVLAWDGETIRP